MQQVEDVGLGRHAGPQGEFDGGEHDLLVMLEDQRQDLHHLSVTAWPLEQMLLQGSKRRRHLGEGGAVAQGAGLALDHGQIMAPVIDGPAQAIVRARKHAAMLTDRLTLGDDDDPVGIDPQAHRAVGEGSRHAVAIALEMDETGRGNPLGVFYEAVKRPRHRHQVTDLFGPRIGDRARLRAVLGL